MSPAEEHAVEALDAGPVSVAAAPSLRAKLKAYYELGKPNLSGLVVMTGVLGFYLGQPHLDAQRLILLVAGLWGTATGAGGLNMVIERRTDAVMRRTRGRPMPSGRTGAVEAAAFSVLVFAAGFATLWIGLNPLTALLSLATAVIYTAIYTPLKKRGFIATWIGAIPGAIPPMMGWTAARGAIDAPGLALFGILFVWQFPHFIALSWMYREDYARAGFDFLPGRDATGRTTSLGMLIGTLLLLPATLALVPLGVAGAIYGVGAALAGLAFAATALRARRLREARTVFFASIIYLPALLALLVLDRAIG